MSDTPETAAGVAPSDDDIVIGMEEEAADEAPVLERRDGGESNGLKRAIFNVPIEVIVSVGVAKPLIGDLLNIGRNQLLPLENAIDDPVELRVRDKVIARGELTQVPDSDGQLGVRLTEIVNIAELAE